MGIGIILGIFGLGALCMLRPFVVALREEKIFPKRGRWMANYVVIVLSILFEYAIDCGWMKVNPADGIKKIRRDSKKQRSSA